MLAVVLCLLFAALCHGSNETLTPWNTTFVNSILGVTVGGPQAHSIFVLNTLVGPNANIYGYLFPCRGANITLYMALGRGILPIPGQVNDLYDVESGVPGTSVQHFSFTEIDETVLEYIAVVTDSPADTPAIFDLFMVNDPSFVNSKTPVPGGSSGKNTISGTYNPKKGNAGISWTVTDDPTDEFKIYRYDVSRSAKIDFPRAGYYASACSTRLWMSPVNTPIKVSGTKAEATIEKIVPENAAVIVVQAQRKNGYAAQYQYVVINEAGGKGAAAWVVLGCLVAALLSSRVF
jgi:hypothetical protein